MVEKFINLYGSYTGHYRNSEENCKTEHANSKAIGRMRLVLNDAYTEVISVELIPLKE